MGVRTKTSGQGRPKGALNRATKSVRELAGNFSEAAIGVLVRIMADPMAPHASKVAACREILDRGHGKPSAATSIKVPKGTLAEQGSALIAAATSGQLPLDHLSQLMAALSAQAKLIETSELTDRLDELRRLLHQKEQQ